MRVVAGAVDGCIDLSLAETCLLREMVDAHAPLIGASASRRDSQQQHFALTGSCMVRLQVADGRAREAQQLALIPSQHGEEFERGATTTLEGDRTTLAPSHISVWERLKREDGVFSTSDFRWV
jgi:hypothetical protein